MSKLIEPQIREFVAAVAKLNESSKPFALDLLQVLTLRQNLASALKEARIDATQLDLLSTADEQLKKLFQTDRLIEFVDRVSQWRASVGADSEQWWWNLDAISHDADAKTTWYWTALAGLILTISIGFMTEVASRFLKDGPDLYGAISIVVQALLAIVTGSALTEAGRLRLGRLFDALKLPPRRQTALTTSVAVLTFVLAAALYFSLPWLARLYNDHGDARRMAGSLLEASDAFKRAIALQPDYAQAHYNLAVVYEDILQLDKATVEYRTAVALDPAFGRAQNNLAHVILTDGKYSGVALGILDKLISRFGNAPLTADEQYAAYKNRAWAKIILNEATAAEADARKALAIKANGASAHCLLAKSLEASANTDARKAENKSHWEACLGFASEDISVNPAWLVEARRKAQSK